MVDSGQRVGEVHRDPGGTCAAAASSAAPAMPTSAPREPSGGARRTSAQGRAHRQALYPRVPADRREQLNLGLRRHQRPLTPGTLILPPQDPQWGHNNNNSPNPPLPHHGWGQSRPTGGAGTPHPPSQSFDKERSDGPLLAQESFVAGVAGVGQEVGDVSRVVPGRRRYRNLMARAAGARRSTVPRPRVDGGGGQQPFSCAGAGPRAGSPHRAANWPMVSSSLTRPP